MEYRDGYKICSDCNTDLVDELEPIVENDDDAYDDVNDDTDEEGNNNENSDDLEPYFLMLEDVLTPPEAAKIWKLRPSTITEACEDSFNGDKDNPFEPWEYRKSEDTWLITRQGMEKLYGKPPCA